MKQLKVNAYILPVKLTHEPLAVEERSLIWKDKEGGLCGWEPALKRICLKRCKIHCKKPPKLDAFVLAGVCKPPVCDGASHFPVLKGLVSCQMDGGSGT